MITESNQSRTEIFTRPVMIADLSYVSRHPSLRVAFTSVMTALVTVSTLIIMIPIPQTGGYFNVGEAMIYITALLFGPFIGGFAGGCGAALADLLAGYAMFAPITFVAKALEGIVVGFIYHALIPRVRTVGIIWKKILAVVCGGACMVLIYFLAEYYLLQMNEAAFTEIPTNLIQMLGGMILSLIITSSVDGVLGWQVKKNPTQFVTKHPPSAE